MTTKYFNVKQGITTGNILLDGITGNITANNANLGNALTANFFIGSGNNLSNISGANVSGQVGNALISGTVYTNAQPNITSVGTLTSLDVTGNVTGGNLITTGIANIGTLAVTGNVTGGNLITTGAVNAGTLAVTGTSNLGAVGNVTITGGTNGQVLSTNGSGGLSFISVSSSGISNGTSNVNIPTVNGNINLTAGGNTSLVVTATGANIVGNLDVTGNLTAGNITTAGAAGNITGANNISANTFTSIIATGTAPFTVTSTTQVANLNVATSGTAVAVTGNAQGNITSVGTLTSLNVVGTVTAAAFTANTGVFTGNGNGLSSIVGANVTGQVGNALVAGTVYTNAQPNITSVGTLTSLLVSGNANVGNLTTPGVLSVTGNANVGNLGTAVLIATGTGSFGGNVNMNSFNITSLATPVNDTDAATKAYVDSTAQGLDPKASVVYATTTTIFGSGYTYNNGTSGVGATITSSSNGALSIDGSTPTVSSRVLIKDEVGAFVNTTTQSAAFNGIYVVTQVGSGAAPFILTRSTDFDVGTEMPGAFTFVEQGTVNADTGWVATVNSPVTVGTSQIIWSQFSSAGSYTAGTGLTLVGNQFNISNTAVTAGSYGNGDRVSTFTVNQQGQLTAASNTAITANAANLTGTALNANIVTSNLTSVGTLGNLTVSGNISAGNISAGAGSGGNITGANLVSANFFTGTLTTNAQPNITSVGTLTSLTVTGNVTGGNLITTGAVNAGTLAVTGTSNLGAVGNVTITGGTSGQVLSTNGSGGLSFISVSSSGISNGTSNVNIPAVNGNVNISAGGNANILIVTSTGVNVAGTLNVTGNASLGNLVTSGSGGNIANANNVSANTFTSIIATGTAPFVVTSTTQVANLNVATAGTVTTNAQPNITSVGSLTGLTVSNATGIVDFTTTANVTLGAIANLHISGGTSGQVLSTNGSGGLSFVSVSSSSISNGTSNVNIPVVNGNVDITSAGNTTMVITGTGANVTGTFTASNNVTGAQLVSTIAVGTAPFIVTSTTQVANLNVATSGTAVAVTGAAQGNITSVGTLTSLDVTGNISGNNISANRFTSTIATGTAPFVVSSTTQVANLNVATAGTATLAVAVTGNAQGNITSVGTLTSLDVTGNISGGNISTVGTANVGTLIVTGATNFGNLTANYVALNGGLTSNRSNVVVTTNTVVDQFAPGTFRTAKYIISASGDDGFQSVETLLIHDGTTAYITIYGSICSNNTADIIELSSNINGVSGNVAVYATGTSANLKVNLVSTYIKT